MRLRWTSPALADLDAALAYLSRRDPAAAARVAARIVESTDRLPAHPELGRPGRVAGTRELVVSGTAYLVPYRVRDDEVEILAVFHGARKPE